MMKSSEQNLIALELAKYLLKGKMVTILPASKKKVRTFRCPFGVWGKGKKAMTLRNSGYYLR